MPDEIYKVSSLLHYAAAALLCVPPVRVDYVVVGAGVPSHYGCWRDSYLHYIMYFRLFLEVLGLRSCLRISTFLLFMFLVCFSHRVFPVRAVPQHVCVDMVLTSKQMTIVC